MSVRTMTRVVVSIARTETCTYEFEGAVDTDAALELIGTGEYEPADSNIRSEDIDVVDLRVMRR